MAKILVDVMTVIRKEIEVPDKYQPMIDQIEKYNTIGLDVNEHTIDLWEEFYEAVNEAHEFGADILQTYSPNGNIITYKE